MKNQDLELSQQIVMLGYKCNKKKSSDKCVYVFYRNTIASVKGWRKYDRTFYVLFIYCWQHADSSVFCCGYDPIERIHSIQSVKGPHLKKEFDKQLHKTQLKKLEIFSLREHVSLFQGYRWG